MAKRAMGSRVKHEKEKNRREQLETRFTEICLVQVVEKQIGSVRIDSGDPVDDSLLALSIDQPL